MRLPHGRHFGYCTNVHPASSWPELRRVLDGPVRAVRQRVAARENPFGLGLWLSCETAESLGEPGALEELKSWLRANGSYVFTLNGFPHGKFHGEAVKENIYRPDWTTRARLDYTVRLFELLAGLLPADVVCGSISTLPGSFKGFGLDDSAEALIFRNLAECAVQIDRRRDRHGRDLVLGLEPEPLGWFENTAETLDFFKKFFARPDTPRCAREVIGVTCDACHLAVEFEDAADALAAWHDAGIRLAKIHFSSALRLRPGAAALAALRHFDEPVYLHQVIARDASGHLRRWHDLPEALAAAENLPPLAHGGEWRVHFHVPLHAAPAPPLLDTRENLAGIFDFLARHPALGPHLEMETYTWAVLPEPLRATAVEEQIAAEYAWTLAQLRQRGLSA
ncbi:MAG TPA: metabolite traffic protein EboE [Opitutales bacterium]|nr:metabolite traffic protein EboE [Opitutales bacterium]